jgi:periplasmic divalent cation tolerance protein
VDERLAACINIVNGVQSIYRWGDQIQDDNEALLIIKAARSRYAELEARLTELHPFEIPEILALPVSDGLNKYLDWVISKES